MTHGGFGYAKEFHVERYLRESLIPRIAPVSPRADPELHRREGAGPAEVVLMMTVLKSLHSSFRGDAKQRARNP